MSYEDFRRLFEKGVRRTLVMAQELVRQNLPPKLSFFLAVGVEPSRRGDADSIVSVLYRSGSFPRIIDLAVCGIEGDETVVWVRPSAHALATNLEQTWNQPPGAGPFKALGLSLPAYLWTRERPFQLSDLKEGFSVLRSSESGGDR